MAVSRKIRREMQKTGTQQKPSLQQKKVKPGAPTKKRTSPVQFFREVKSELQRVSWPDRNDLVSSTAMVLAAVLVVTGIVYMIDMVFSQAATLLTK